MGDILYIVNLHVLKNLFKKNSTILTASDAGWINGHTYALYGPLSIGSTTVLLESPICFLNIFFKEGFK